MISPLCDLEKDELTECINTLNEKFHVQGFCPMRFNYSELRNVALFLIDNSDGWSFQYNDEILSRFNYAEVAMIKRISKYIDDDDMLKQIKHDMKVHTQATRRICTSVIEEMKNKNKKSVKDKLIGVFTNA